MDYWNFTLSASKNVSYRTRKRITLDVELVTTYATSDEGSKLIRACVEGHKPKRLGTDIDNTAGALEENVLGYV